jgi:PTH1 family peptidyl-tRNA hydrolase
MIRLFVGLGNPGTEYEATRHNAGFWWIDALAERWKARLAAERAYRARLARISHGGHPVWLMQPMTYMNHSGQAVAALARFFKIAAAEILVAYDELDLPPGAAKLKQGGGAAGHNGIRDVQAQLGNSEFWRLRLGIGHPGVKAEVADYVLRKPAPEDRDAIRATIARTLDAADLLAEGAMEHAVMKIHAKPPRPKPPPTPVGEPT